MRFLIDRLIGNRRFRSADDFDRRSLLNLTYERNILDQMQEVCHLQLERKTDLSQRALKNQKNLEFFRVGGRKP